MSNLLAGCTFKQVPYKPLEGSGTNYYTYYSQRSVSLDPSSQQILIFSRTQNNTRCLKYKLISTEDSNFQLEGVASFYETQIPNTDQFYVAPTFENNLVRCVITKNSPLNHHVFACIQILLFDATNGSIKPLYELNESAQLLQVLNKPVATVQFVKNKVYVIYSTEMEYTAAVIDVDKQSFELLAEGYKKPAGATSEAIRPFVEDDEVIHFFVSSRHLVSFNTTTEKFSTSTVRIALNSCVTNSLQLYTNKKGEAEPESTEVEAALEGSSTSTTTTTAVQGLESTTTPVTEGESTATLNSYVPKELMKRFNIGLLYASFSKATPCYLGSKLVVMLYHEYLFILDLRTMQVMEIKVLDNVSLHHSTTFIRNLGAKESSSSPFVEDSLIAMVKDGEFLQARLDVLNCTYPHQQALRQLKQLQKNLNSYKTFSDASLQTATSTIPLFKPLLWKRLDKIPKSEFLRKHLKLSVTPFSADTIQKFLTLLFEGAYVSTGSLKTEEAELLLLLDQFATEGVTYFINNSRNSIAMPFQFQQLIQDVSYFSDFTVSFQCGEKLDIHSILFVLASEFFRNMLVDESEDSLPEDDDDDDEEDELPEGNIDEETFKQLYIQRFQSKPKKSIEVNQILESLRFETFLIIIEYVYCRNLTMFDDQHLDSEFQDWYSSFLSKMAQLSIEELLVLAKAVDFFNISVLQRVIEDEIHHSLSLDNCCKVLDFACALNLQTLYQVVFDYVAQHLPTLKQKKLSVVKQQLSEELFNEVMKISDRIANVQRAHRYYECFLDEKRLIAPPAATTTKANTAKDGATTFHVLQDMTTRYLGVAELLTEAGNKCIHLEKPVANSVAAVWATNPISTPDTKLGFEVEFELDVQQAFDRHIGPVVDATFMIQNETTSLLQYDKRFLIPPPENKSSSAISYLLAIKLGYQNSNFTITGYLLGGKLFEVNALSLLNQISSAALDPNKSCKLSIALHAMQFYQNNNYTLGCLNVRVNGTPGFVGLIPHFSFESIMKSFHSQNHYMGFTSVTLDSYASVLVKNWSIKKFNSTGTALATLVQTIMNHPQKVLLKNNTHQQFSEEAGLLGVFMQNLKSLESNNKATTNDRFQFAFIGESWFPNDGGDNILTMLQLLHEEMKKGLQASSSKNCILM